MRVPIYVAKNRPLMESLEGKRGYPRVKPPFPAQKGLWGRPTTINNIESLANVPLIFNNGADWYKGTGAATHPGPLLYGISGHVNRPGVYEYPTGMLVTDLINEVAMGVRGGKRVKALIPGGSSTPPLRGDALDGVRMDFRLTQTGRIYAGNCRNVYPGRRYGHGRLSMAGFPFLPP